jgi:hypothetical protein
MSFARSSAVRMGLCALLFLFVAAPALAEHHETAMEKAGMKCAMQCYDAEDKCEKACPASAADGEACRTTCAETGDGCRKSCPGGGGEPTEADPMPD